MNTMKLVVGVLVVAALSAGCMQENRSDSPATPVVADSNPVYNRANLIPDSIGVAIVYDTSGSMCSEMDGANGSAPKWAYANASLKKVLLSIEGFTTQNTNLWVGLYTFNKKEVAMAKANSSIPAIKKWLKNFETPNDNTPLGPAMQRAGKALVASPASRIHMVVITDGANNRGCSPVEAMSEMNNRKAFIHYHFVAVDMSPSIIGNVKSAGCETLVEAKSGEELSSQLTTIFEEKVLVEVE